MGRFSTIVPSDPGVDSRQHDTSVVIWPPVINRMENDPEKVRVLYEQGRKDALQTMSALKAWLGK